MGPPLPYHMRLFTRPPTRLLTRHTCALRLSGAVGAKSKSQVRQITFSKCNPQEPLAAEAAWLPPWLWLAICAICAFMRFLISAGVGSSLCVAIIQE
jgi:hypothetical protein